MTHRAGGAGTGVPRIWLLPLSVLAALIFVTAAGWLSRSVILDFLAWWPVWLVALLLVIFTRRRRIGRIRLSGIVPLLVTGGLLAFVAGHLLGWPSMPSSAQALVGPPVSADTSAALSARIAGVVQVSSGSEFLYEVHPVRRGGAFGIPGATEQLQSSTISVLLSEPEDPGFYAFAGWDISLSTTPEWNLTLDGEVDADLTSLDVAGLQVFGTGSVSLGQTHEITTATISGVLEVVVPVGAPVRIIGRAEVPSNWESLSDGARSPSPGDGWVISVADGSTVTVSYG